MNDSPTVTTSDIYEKYSNKGYILDLSKLEDGDVILEHGYSKVSPIIELATNCYYTHAMIYLEDTLIEATGDGGVFSRVPNRFYVPYRNDLKVLRLKERAVPFIMDRIKLRARDLVGSSYSVKEAALAGLNPNKKKALLKKINKYQFCSRLVAQCYQYGGISLLENVNYCSPKDIFESDLLFEVTDAVKEATAVEIHHAKSGEAHPNHLKCCVKWVREAKKILKKWDYEVQTINEIIGATINLANKKVDNEICKSIINSGYTTNYLDDKTVNPYRYDLILFSDKMKTTTGNINDKIDSEIWKEISITNLHCKNFNTSLKMHNDTPAGILWLHVELHKNILLIVKERLSIILDYCHKNNITSTNTPAANDMISLINHTIGQIEH
ncbi:TPA: hypothetical protein NU803_004682 [Citrobacter freundii]|nr:hypothetical protein [Citrobacter freundii]